ncbi:MAG: hypothetical protein PHX68_04490 [Alphaproteobacteria bacterium]|nr:hypothetical protein [Alphaproteobacteria bacterium]
MAEQNPQKNDGTIDLYSRIAGAADQQQQQAEVQKKQFQSPILTLMTYVMRARLWMDGLRRDNTALFAAGAWIWALFMAGLYACGIAVVCLAGYGYVSFPKAVRAYCAQNNLTYDTLTVGRTFSKIELLDVRDTAGTYRIGQAVVNSSFGDFLRGRVRSVTMHGLNIKVKDTEKGLSFGGFPQTLWKVNDARQAAVKIDRLSISGATMEIAGQNYVIPISFSVEGVYEDKASVSIPFSIHKEDLVSAEGVLTLEGNGQNIAGKLNIRSGALMLPQQPPEKLSGLLDVVLNPQGVQSVKGGIDLSYISEKKIHLDLKRDKDGMQGTIGLSVKNPNLLNPKEENSFGVQFQVAGLGVRQGGVFETDKPMQVSATGAWGGDHSLSRVVVQAQGKLRCSLPTMCAYQVTAPSRATIDGWSWPVQSDVLTGKKQMAFMVQPSADTLKLDFVQKKVAFNLETARVSVDGVQKIAKNPITIYAGSLTLRGDWLLGSMSDAKIALAAKDWNYKTTQREIKRADMRISNIMSASPDVFFKSPEVSVGDLPVLKVPAAVELALKGNRADMRLTLLNKAVNVRLSGDLFLKSETFAGSIVVPPVDLGKLNRPLSGISHIFPEGIRSLSGTAAASGQIVFKNAHQITGPLSLVLKDVGFSTDTLRVHRMNAALNVYQVMPFITANNQHAFIERVDTWLPFHNTDVLFKVDNKMVRILDLYTNVGGVPLRADAAVVPTTEIKSTVYLKGINSNLGSLSLLRIPNVKLGARWTGSLLIPVEISSAGVWVKNVEARLSSGQITHQKGKAPARELAVRGGNVMVSSSEDGVSAKVDLDTRELPGMAKRIVKETQTIALPQVVLPVPAESIPEDITDRQNALLDEIRDKKLAK